MRLRPYQERALRFLKERCDGQGGGYFAAKPGAGKTGVCWHLISYLHHDTFQVGLTVVIAPKRVVAQWPREARKWGATARLRVQVYEGSLKVRKGLLGRLKQSDVLVVSFEHMEELLSMVRPGLIVFDEASRLRHGGRKGSKTWKVLNATLKRVKGCQLVMLSGSPRPGDAEELYAPVFLLDRGAALGKTLGEFRERFMEPDQKDRHRGIVFSWKLRAGKEREFNDAIRHMFFAASPDLGLKSVTVDRYVELPPAARRRYEVLQAQQTVTLLDFELTAPSMGTLSGKLHQMAQGAVYNPETGETVVVHDEKLDELEALLEELAGERVIIVGWYQHDFERLRARLPKLRTLDTPKDLADALSGQIELLGLHPASAGHGIDGLQTKYAAIVWFSVHPSWELYDQTNSRIVRSGQQETVRIFRILADDTIDLKIAHQILPRKQREQDAFFAAMQG